MFWRKKTYRVRSYYYNDIGAKIGLTTFVEAYNDKNARDVARDRLIQIRNDFRIESVEKIV